MARLSFFSKITVELSNAEGFFALFEKSKCKRFTLQISFQKSHFFSSEKKGKGSDKYD